MSASKKLVVLIYIALLFTGCTGVSEEKKNNPDELKGIITVFHAGSLSVPLKALADTFMRLHPGVQINLESAGSLASARKITDLNKDCDLIAVSDYSVIDDLLIPDHASWNLHFATNEMAIVYHTTSRYAAKISATNWYELLQEKDVLYARSDPNSDPCGYRTLMMLQLAEGYYKVPGLEKMISSKNKEYIRPKETDLIALLESGAVDYIFLYRSVAEQHQLSFITMPEEINLGNPAYDSLYAGSSVQINGDAPGNIKTVSGEAMVYSFTIPDKAPNARLAEDFALFILSEKGKTILTECGQPLIRVKVTGDKDKVPSRLNASLP